MTAADVLREKAKDYRALSTEHSDAQTGMVAVVLLELADALEQASEQREAA